MVPTGNDPLQESVAQELEQLDQQQRQLKAEADGLLRDHGVLSILQDYGRPRIGGSYALDLMTWRDLDLYLEAPNLAFAQFVHLGMRLAERLQPRKMSFTNHRDFPSTEEGIVGLYCGILLRELDRGGWKIDLWVVDEALCAAQLAQGARMASQLTAEQRGAILEIKSVLWNHPEYRKSITSQHVYAAVLEHGVRSMEAFWQWHRDASALGSK